MKFLKLLSVLVFAVVVLAGCGGAVDAKIGGTVNGLASGFSVGLTNLTNADTISVAFNSSGTKFTFDQTIQSGSTYNVTVSTQPAGYICTITNGSGTITSNGGDVTNITVNCAPGTGVVQSVTASVAGLCPDVSGLPSRVTLINTVNSDTLTVIGTAQSATGTITRAFPTQLLPGSIFNISIAAQPTNGQFCQFTPPTSSSGSVPTSGPPPAATLTCTFTPASSC